MSGVRKSSWENGTINKTIMDYRSQASAVSMHIVFPGSSQNQITWYNLSFQ